MYVQSIGSRNDVQITPIKNEICVRHKARVNIFLLMSLREILYVAVVKYISVKHLLR
jgi:hypothetical protein